MLKSAFHAPVAQLDRVLGYEEVKAWFDSGNLVKGIRDLRIPLGDPKARSDQEVTTGAKGHLRDAAPRHGC
jgi:hypothetical protein